MESLALLTGSSVAYAACTAGAFCPLSPDFFNVIGSMPGVNFASGDFGAVVNGIYKLAIRIAGATAVVMFVWSGVQYMTAPLGASGTENAKERMTNAILGLLMLLATWVIFNQINPDILNLQINPNPIQALPDTAQKNGTDAPNPDALPTIPNTGE
jgi:Type IV secretion system pilin